MKPFTKILEKFKAHRARKRQIRERRNQIWNLRMNLEILWDDLDRAEPETNTARIIRDRIEEVTAQLSALRS